MTTTIEVPVGTSALNITQESGRVVIEFAPKFKEGDFVYEDGRIMIIHKYPNFYKARIYPTSCGKVKYNRGYGLHFSSPSFRHTTEEEKQFLLDALEKDGKQWNAEKLCIEDIPQRKFKPGDKVKLKDGMLDKSGEWPCFVAEMGVFIGKILTVKSYTSIGNIFLNEAGDWRFAEDWLELYSDEPIVGELAIFWDSSKECSLIRIYTQRITESHRDHQGMLWANAIKFISKEQFEKHIKD